MTVSSKKLHLLVVEDNPADFILIEDFLNDENANLEIHHALTFASAHKHLSGPINFDAIFLDLSLPDAFGETLVNDIIALAGPTPVIVLTGYADKEFGLNSLKLGVTDYLFKDELSAYVLNKSLTYAIERKHIHNELKESEQKYKDLFQANPQPMWVFDMETLRFLNVNQAAIRHYGYSRKEFLGMTIKDIRPKEDIDKVLKQIAINKVSNEFSREVFRHIKKNGEIILVEISSNSIDFEVKPARIILANDITRKVEAEQAIQHSEQRFKALIQEGSDLIGIVDQEGICKYMSPASETLLGITVEELIGKNVFDFVHEEDKKEVTEKFSLLSIHKRLFIPPFRFKKGNNEWCWIETIVTDMMDDPAVGGIVANSRDVTERKEYIEAIEEHNQKLHEIAWMQSHLVRAPLARILAIVDMLNDQSSNGENMDKLLSSLRFSATELDNILRKIVNKTERVEFKNKNES